MIAKLCKILNVTTSGYYAWDKRPVSDKAKKKDELTTQVKHEFYTNHEIPGANKIAKALSVDRKTVLKIMIENGLRSKVCKKYKATTNSAHNLPVVDNVLNREFTAKYANEKWLSDITYVLTEEGWLYLAGMLDLYDHDVVGWSMGDRMTKDLVINCLRMAKTRRGNPKGVLAHSDRGSQYCSNDYQNELSKDDFVCSMSRKGNCWDNAPMESFWGKLKQEWLNDKHF